MTPPGTSRTRCTNALTRSNRAAARRSGGRAVGMALLLLSAGPPVRLSAQAGIDTIVVVNHNIFDLQDDAPGFLARLANGLHVTTRAGVIRRTLLVNPGDRYDSARVAESERALRGLYVFSRVRLDSTRVAGRLALRVETFDGWSTKPQFGYSSAGGDVTWTAGPAPPSGAGRCGSVSARASPPTPRAAATCGSGSAGSGAVRISAPRACCPSSRARRSRPRGREWTSGTCAFRCWSASTRTRGVRTWTSPNCCTLGCGPRPAPGAIRRAAPASARKRAAR